MSNILLSDKSNNKTQTVTPSDWQDSNLRSPDPKSGVLPNYTTASYFRRYLRTLRKESSRSGTVVYGYCEPVRFMLPDTSKEDQSSRSPSRIRTLTNRVRAGRTACYTKGEYNV